LLLAAIGLYGVTSYTVARRTSEIGIRMALGAQRSNVIGLVMRGALTQTLVGLAIGVPAILLCARFVESLLFEVKALAVWSRSRFSPWLPPRLSPAFFRRVARLRPIQRRRCEPNDGYADRVVSTAAG